MPLLGVQNPEIEVREFHLRTETNRLLYQPERIFGRFNLMLVSPR